MCSNLGGNFGISVISLWSAIYIYMLPIASIMRHHIIYFHIYADDTQLYVYFDLSNPIVALDRMNLCISDLRIWMIRNKLKVDDSKTGF